MESLKSLTSIPSILDTTSSSNRKNSLESSHRDLEATVTATNLGSDDSNSSDNGRLVTNHMQSLNGHDNSVSNIVSNMDHDHNLSNSHIHPSSNSNTSSASSSLDSNGDGTNGDGTDKVGNNALVSASGSPTRQMAINPLTIPTGQNFVDITEYLNMPQSEAAKKLNIPASTLSKRWKEAVRTRKWPWRVVCKLDKEIMTLLHNVPQGAPIPKEIEARLGFLMRKRQEELKPVVIRL